MSPDIIGYDPRTSGESDEPEEEPWPDETAHLVVVNKPFSTSIENLPDALIDEYGVDTERDRHVTFRPGEEIPETLVTPAVWKSVGGWRILALDSAGQRLNPVTTAETRGDVDYAEDLETWRQGANLDFSQVYECGECGKTFSSRDALNGHGAAHADRDDDAVEEVSAE
ncbi:hypothetical protein HSRCO_0820 [Halanaeroarchaeum sp. HSR-CO]|uniref:C2H2-type zinc finger protein n=1 Tax=Halanaeroarchaeum sp. HSR-CO TaxID=2866382 RepID=UPI00217E9514|nr:C2H2-type zinc finger protein [Halanaeroarchaeum sp. HSR-CO]UWG47110.1 hypothetical protein HSRCO_0820 [Halanaeroarchaeum sp. HSR-CO]